MNYKRLMAICLFVGFVFGTTLSFADYSAYVYTPKGTRVAVTVRTWELSYAEIVSINNRLRAAYPNATFIGNSSRKYNCHSYAWYYPGANSVWMDYPNAYMTDGSYWGYSMLIPPYNYRVNYPWGNHSAVSIGSGVVKSKWGMGPLMRHGVQYGPYNMSLYYSYRRSS